MQLFPSSTFIMIKFHLGKDEWKLKHNSSVDTISSEMNKEFKK